MTSDEDREDLVPLREQRYFGSGLKRKRIDFVPATSHVTKTATPTKGEEVRKWYLELVGEDDSTSAQPGVVLSNDDDPGSNAGNVARVVSTMPDSSLPITSASTDPICEVCYQPIKNGDRVSHDQRLDHIMETRLNTVSSVDRKRKGLSILQSQGFDPDGGKGLGIELEGMPHPLKAIEKPGKAGIGFMSHDPDDVSAPTKKAKPPPAPDPPRRLGPNELRQQAIADKIKTAELRSEFYGNSELKAYLGEHAYADAGTLNPNSRKARGKRHRKH